MHLRTSQIIQLTQIEFSSVFLVRKENYYPVIPYLFIKIEVKISNVIFIQRSGLVYLVYSREKRCQFSQYITVFYFYGKYI